MRELAQLAGVSPDTIRRIERHDADAHYATIRKLAAALDVEPIELMAEEDR
jgi:transcriptional regulator with XRE-family HTH domain